MVRGRGVTEMQGYGGVVLRGHAFTGSAEARGYEGVRVKICPDLSAPI